jgi:hypothetical protein
MTMTDNEYLTELLASQALSDDSYEMKELTNHRKDVEGILRDKFAGAAPTIRYGGSKAKGTLNRESYDLDVVFYVPNDNNAAGDTLKDIYNNVKNELSKYYDVQLKTSAIRLRSKAAESFGRDFHIDVVPGRFTDDKKSDCFLCQSGGDKERLKTNLDVHIVHIRDSGVVDAIRIFKLLRCRKALRVRQFVLELLVVDLLKAKKKAALENQLKHVLQVIAGSEEPIKVEDPANPSGNDLTDLLSDGIWQELRGVARSVLDTVGQSGWQAMFGKIATGSKDARIARATVLAGVTAYPTKPWCS